MRWKRLRRACKARVAALEGRAATALHHLHQQRDAVRMLPARQEAPDHQHLRPTQLSRPFCFFDFSRCACLPHASSQQAIDHQHLRQPISSRPVCACLFGVCIMFACFWQGNKPLIISTCDPNKLSRPGSFFSLGVHICHMLLGGQQAPDHQHLQRPTSSAPDLVSLLLWPVTWGHALSRALFIRRCEYHVSQDLALRLSSAGPSWI